MPLRREERATSVCYVYVCMYVQCRGFAMDGLCRWLFRKCPVSSYVTVSCVAVRNSCIETHLEGQGPATSPMLRSHHAAFATRPRKSRNAKRVSTFFSKLRLSRRDRPAVLRRDAHSGAQHSRRAPCQGRRPPVNEPRSRLAPPGVQRRTALPRPTRPTRASTILTPRIPAIGGAPSERLRRSRPTCSP